MDIVKDLIHSKEELLNNIQSLKGNIQHGLNKLTPFERTTKLFDENSFVEVGAMTQKDGSGVLTGYGTVNGRLVFVYSQDYTVDGGALNSFNSKKISRIMDMAVKMGAPLVQIYDSVGASLTEGIETLEAYGRIIGRNTKLSGVIPQIAVIAGNCTGIFALSAAMSDFSIIVENSGNLYISTPETLTEKHGNHVDSDMYANFEKCTKNGSVQICSQNEDEALQMVRKLIDTVPSNNLETAEVVTNKDVINEVQAEIDNMVNNNDVNIDEVLRIISDRDSIIEFNKNYDIATKTVLMKMNGSSIGVIAVNNGARLDVKGLDKITHMIKICNCFNIPLLCLVNSEGFVQNIDEEKNGLAVSAAKMMCSLSQAVVPKVALITGKAYGAIYTAFCSKESAADMVYAWPNAKIALTEPELIIKTLYKDEIMSAEEPKKKEIEIIKEKTAEVTSPYKAAQLGYIDDVIIPSQTRVMIVTTFDMLLSKRVVDYPRKHMSVLL